MRKTLGKSDCSGNFILYGNQNSGHSYKIALSLRLMSIPYEYIHVSLAGSIASRPDEFLNVSRFGQVPVLVQQSKSICESNAILLSLAEQTGLFAGQSTDESAQIREWLFWEASGIGFSLANLRYLYLSEQVDDPMRLFYETRLKKDLKILSSELDEKDFLAGNSLSIADISCCGYLFWIEQAGANLSDWPNIRKWLEKISSTPNWVGPTDLMSIH